MIIMVIIIVINTHKDKPKLDHIVILIMIGIRNIRIGSAVKTYKIRLVLSDTSPNPLDKHDV